MDRLTLARDLKAVLAAIDRCGGDIDLHVDIPRDVLQGLREHVFRLCESRRVPSSSGSRLPFEFEVLTEPQWFERALRFALVRLRQGGIPEQKQLQLLQGALELLTSSIFDGAHLPRHWESNANEEGPTYEELSIVRVTECFRPGYYPDKVAQYDLLEEHGLITWHWHRATWTLTNLGRYARELRLFSLLLFLLGLQLCFGRERRRRRYLTSELLHALVVHGGGRPLDHQDLPKSLTWFGIVDDLDQQSGKMVISDFGYQLLRAAQAREEELRDLVLLLVETDAHGFELPNADTYGEEACPRQLASSASVASLAGAGKHLEALRVLYPSIEALLDRLLEEEGLAGKKYSGMKQKFEELVQVGRIPRRVGNFGEIIASRNKILHGNIHDDADDLCNPLYRLVVEFARVLIRETKPRSAES